MENNGKSSLLKTVGVVGTVLTFLGLHLVIVVQMGEMREGIGEMRAEMRGDIARVEARIDGLEARMDSELTAMRADLGDLKNDSREIRNLIVTHIIEHGGQKIAARGDAAAKTAAKQ